MKFWESNEAYKVHEFGMRLKLDAFYEFFDGIDKRYESLSKEVQGWKNKVEREQAIIDKWEGSSEEVRVELGDYMYKQKLKRQGKTVPELTITRGDMFDYLASSWRNRDTSMFPETHPSYGQDGPIVTFYDKNTGKMLDHDNDESIPTYDMIRKLKRLRVAVKTFERPDYISKREAAETKAWSEELEEVWYVLSRKQLRDHLEPVIRKENDDLTEGLEKEFQWRRDWFVKEGLEPRDFDLGRLASQRMATCTSREELVKHVKEVVKLFPEWVQFGTAKKNDYGSDDLWAIDDGFVPMRSYDIKAWEKWGPLHLGGARKQGIEFYTDDERVVDEAYSINWERHFGRLLNDWKLQV